MLIFTSNLGIIVDDPDDRERIPTVTRGMEYEELEAQVKAAIGDHFTTEIGRPELLNRFGDNIVVFDFISQDVAARSSTCSSATSLGRASESWSISLVLEPRPRRAARRCTGDLANGGRGIGSVFESSLSTRWPATCSTRTARPA